MNPGSLIRALSALTILGLLLSALPSQAVSSSGWGVEQLIETDDSGHARLPQLAVDSSGNVIAVWMQDNIDYTDIWSNRYVVGSGWGVAQLVDWGTYDASSPQVGVDDSGNAVAVWYQFDGVYYSIWANRYVVGSGWGSALRIESNDGSAEIPMVAVDGEGNAIAVWIQDDGLRYNVWANRFTVETGWGTAETLESDTGNVWGADIAVDHSGNAIAVWDQFDGERYNVLARRFVVGSGWGTPETIDTISEDAIYPRVAMDGSGNAIAVWKQVGDAQFDLWANRFEVGTGWGTPEMLETNDYGGMYWWSVDADDSGGAMAVWSQSDGVCASIYACRYVAESGWGDADLIETDDSGNAEAPVVGIDGSGNAIVAWALNDETVWKRSVWANRYVAGTGWEDPQLIEGESGDAKMPAIAVDSAGNAIAAWAQRGASYDNVLANRFAAPDITPPPLTLSSPSDGMTTETPVVTVSGTTEPGAVVSVDGTLAAVGDDGGFSCDIALDEGSNTIVVTATDASGNYVSLSRTVVYDNPLVGLVDELTDELEEAMEDLNKTEYELENLRNELEGLRDDLDMADEELSGATDDVESMRSQNLMLMVGLVIAAMLAVVALAMYFGLSRKMSRMGERSAKENLPPPPA
jgi:hypothetical protein